MARNRKPRKAYRPRPVLLDALTLLQPAPKAQRDAVLLRLHTALESMARGSHPGPQEWRDMADVVNTLETLTVRMEVLDAATTQPVVDRATAAMVAAERRYRSTGRAGLDGPGLQALRDALQIYTQAANGLTQHAMARARELTAKAYADSRSNRSERIAVAL